MYLAAGVLEGGGRDDKLGKLSLSRKQRNERRKRKMIFRWFRIIQRGLEAIEYCISVSQGL